MKRIAILLGVAILFSLVSCKKKAADMIVGHWEVSYYDNSFFPSNTILEFNPDGTLRIGSSNGGVYDGYYRVNGPEVSLDFNYRQFSGRITYMSEETMDWIITEYNDRHWVSFHRTSQSIPENIQEGDRYYINVRSNPSGGGYVSGDGYFDYLDRCILIADPSPGYVFANLMENNEVVSTEEHYSFTVTRNRELMANFYNGENYYIHATVNPVAGGCVIGDGYYNEYDDCVLEAVANPGYVFSNWTEFGDVVSAGATITFTVTRDRDFVANFVFLPD